MPQGTLPWMIVVAMGVPRIDTNRYARENGEQSKH